MGLIKEMEITANMDYSKVRKNEDGSIIVGDPNAPICYNGDTVLESLTKTKKRRE